MEIDDTIKWIYENISNKNKTFTNVKCSDNLMIKNYYEKYQEIVLLTIFLDNTYNKKISNFLID